MILGDKMCVKNSNECHVVAHRAKTMFNLVILLQSGTYMLILITAQGEVVYLSQPATFKVMGVMWLLSWQDDSRLRDVWA